MYRAERLTAGSLRAKEGKQAAYTGREKGISLNRVARAIIDLRWYVVNTGG